MRPWHLHGQLYTWDATELWCSRPKVVYQRTDKEFQYRLLCRPPRTCSPSQFSSINLISFCKSLPTISALPPVKLNGSIPVMVPEGALTLPLHFCSSPSCGAAVGVTKGSLHLRGRPTSSWESRMEVVSERITDQQTCLFVAKWTEKRKRPLYVLRQQFQDVGCEHVV